MNQKSIDGVIEEIGQVYSDLARQHGCDPKAGGYHDQDKRDIRYAKLAEIFQLDNAPDVFSVAELGCGYGAFYNYLDERLPGRISHYYGYDVSSEMLELGQVHLKGRPVTLTQSSSVTDAADYTFISGIFNVRLLASVHVWQDYIEGTLSHSFAMTRRGLVFNTLTNKVDFRNEKFNYSDPDTLAEWCRNNLSTRVRVVQNYGMYEFTMFILR